MALLTVSGEPGCRVEEVARLAAQRLGFELFNEARLGRMLAEEFDPGSSIPDKAWPHFLASLLARLASRHHLVACMPGAGLVLRQYPAVLRTRLIAPPAYRAGMLMLDRQLERPKARELLKQLDEQQKQARRRRFGRATAPPELYDFTINAALMEPEVIAGTLACAARALGLPEQGLMPAAVEAEVQFQVRLELARHRVRPPGDVSLQAFEGKEFVHPSEEIFANLLNFYRIAWEYEPRSFPLQWDETGQVLEAFTPDFYLPDLDLYIELTTMRQALVTKKNRKVRRLKKIYPDVNIQVFYQKDFQNLIFKYGLTERTIEV
jgi:cytidylate kinase